MVDPFPPRPVIAKVDAYIPPTTPPLIHNPPPYTHQSQGQHHARNASHDIEAGDPFVAHKPLSDTGDPFARGPVPAQVPPHYIQHSQIVQERQERESWCINRFLVGLSMVLLLVGIVAVVVKISGVSS
ncbi:hypothetical protein BKA65DRAFT_540047 [Rhexocercosporidium sp. MPI-PUGE-AT-0058]|nr:hypothetical protein BKA65DRAFT_540047 [Rhexocercosporidium sp. MPI-PUGE-AT-0058]